MTFLDILYVLFTALILAYPLYETKLIDEKYRQRILYFIYAPLAFVLLVLIIWIIMSTNDEKIILSEKLEEQGNHLLLIETRPDFNQNMWEVITGIPASIFKDYHTAMDLFDSKDYSNCSKKIQLAINGYEKIGNWNTKDYDAKQHKEKLREIYTLASKAYNYNNQHKLSYKYSRKALELNIKPTYYAYYLAAVPAYNLKKYTESIEMISNAINLNPPNELLQICEQIKEKCLKHLNKK